MKLKRVTTKTYGYGSEFCSSSVYINSDSTFLCEFGCEGRSHVVIGTWEEKNDSIELKETPQANIRLVRRLDMSKEYSNSGSVYFYIVDNTNRPVERFLIYASNSKNKEINAFKSDSMGKVSVLTLGIDSLEFPQMHSLTNKSHMFSTNDLRDTVKLIMNTNSAAFFYSNVSYIFNENLIKYKIVEQGLRGKRVLFGRIPN